MKPLSPGKKEQFVLLTILLVASVLRLLHLAGFSFSNDELSALYRIRFDRFSDLVSQGFYVDGHPGGIQVFLYYWVKAVGTSEFAVRLPFALAGILAVYVAYRLGKRWFNAATGSFAALLVAILQFPVLFSQVARPYATGLLFVLMAAWFWTRLIFDYDEMNRRMKGITIAGYILSTTLCMYNHYFSFLMAGIIGLSGLFFLRRSNSVPYLLSGAASILLFLPHLPITLNHLRIGGVGLWLGKPSWDFLFTHIFYIFNESWYLLVVVFGIVAWMIWKHRNALRFNTFQVLCLVWFLLPMITGFVYSRAVNPVLQHSVLIFSFPFLLYFLFSFSGSGFNRSSLLLLFILFAAGVVSLRVEKNYYHTQHFGEFRDIAHRVAAWDDRYDAGNIARAINVNDPWYIDFYLQKEGSQATFAQYQNRGGKDLLALKHIVEQSTTPLFVYAWTKPTPTETEEIVREAYPYVIERHEYGGLSAVSLYSRQAPTPPLPDPVPVLVVRNGFEQAGRWKADPGHMDSVHVFRGAFSYRLDGKTEYSPAFDTVLYKISGHPIRSIKVSLWGLIPPAGGKTPIVIAVDDTRGQNYCWASMNMENFLDPSVWGKAFFNYELPRIRSSGDRLKIYVWNPDKYEFNIDEMEIRFYE
ncbi:MAG: glycosyltransferase family 39 protein [Bacteroidales bacterium]|nr:glycosyltransferase family 39 protein [Lentimicrobiaceae bacterium]MDD5695059.1 glycosyltransferase family 39 protein [Bacteroidales bacterium]